MLFSYWSVVQSSQRSKYAPTLGSENKRVYLPNGETKSGNSITPDSSSHASETHQGEILAFQFHHPVAMNPTQRNVKQAHRSCVRHAAMAFMCGSCEQNALLATTL